MGGRRRRARFDREVKLISMNSIAHDGRGVGRDEDGKVIFVDYALPDEKVSCETTHKRQGQLFARAIEIHQPSQHRVKPECVVFGQCGGCILQHLDGQQQIKYKQQQLLENLKKIGHVTPQNILSVMTGPQWGYRRRARLGVKYVPKKGGVIVGFRERNSSFIQPTEQCNVLHPAVSKLLPELRETIAKLSCPDRIPQVEISVADNAIALIIRHLEAFLQEDLDHLSNFAKQHSLHLFLQPGNLKSVHPLYPNQPEPLFYNLDDIEIEFLPTDFIQVNADINQQLVNKAIELLDIQTDDSVLDLFCGVGNFTLPLATKAKQVTGIEGDQALVTRARHNKLRNNLNNVGFEFNDLFDENMTAQSHGDWLTQSYDKVLIDPPRSGAAEIIKRLPDLGANKLVYVSCNPSTLARDAGTLVHEHQYTLTHGGVIDMFPHTAHVESIAVFEK